MWQIILGNMQSLGLYEFIFPFLLILAISYGVLRYSLKEILPKSAAGLVSIIIGFFVMNYSGTAGYQLSKFFSTLFGGGLIVASGILVLVIILGLLGLKIGNITKGEGTKTTAVFVIAVLFVVFLIVIGATGSYIPGIMPITITQDFWTIIFFVVILVIVLWVLGREEETGGAGAGEGKGE